MPYRRRCGNEAEASRTRLSGPESSRRPPSAKPALCGIIMGSRSDWPTLQKAAEILTELGVPYEAKVVSAHRTPDRLVEPTPSPPASAASRSSSPGPAGRPTCPAWSPPMTSLPVLGVPVKSSALSGLDSLLSIVQMPEGHAGRHAGHRRGWALPTLASSRSRCCAQSDEALVKRLDAFRKAQTDSVAETVEDGK